MFVLYIPVYLCGMSLSNTTFNLIIDFPGVTMKLKISSTKKLIKDFFKKKNDALNSYLCVITGPPSSRLSVAIDLINKRLKALLSCC